MSGGPTEWDGGHRKGRGEGLVMMSAWDVSVGERRGLGDGVSLGRVRGTPRAGVLSRCGLLGQMAP